MKALFKVDKLVRDHLNIPGVRGFEGTLSYESYIKQLCKKLLEEVHEIQDVLEHSENEEDLLEECSDLLEVLHALVRAKGHTLEALEEVRKKKTSLRGGFEKRIYCAAVEVDPTQEESFRYYKELPKKYAPMDSLEEVHALLKETL